MLQVEHLTKEFKNLTAVDDVSFTVEPGRIFGLLGPNGAGKTTTIRTVLNIIRPTKGTVLYNGKKIGKEFFNNIGYLPEERGLYKKSRVIDVIIYFAGLKNMTRHSAETEADKWLDILEIKNYKNKKIEELSKGNQQKVQFICAVVHDPGLLILDEPFSGFDPINQQKIKDTLFSFLNTGKVIILSTHQMETAEKLCSEIFLINKGKEVCSGSIASIKKNFGGNNVKLEYEGDASFLSGMSCIKHVDGYSNYAEIQLNDGKEPYEFLKEIVNRLKISHFSVVEPTLNKIFIDVINQNSN